MRDNPLINAVIAREAYVEQVEIVAEAIGGEKRYGMAVYEIAEEFIIKGWDATLALSFRATCARLNAIWKEFLEQQKKREARDATVQNQS